MLEFGNKPYISFNNGIKEQMTNNFLGKKINWERKLTDFMQTKHCDY